MADVQNLTRRWSELPAAPGQQVFIDPTFDVGATDAAAVKAKRVEEHLARGFPDGPDPDTSVELTPMVDTATLVSGITDLITAPYTGPSFTIPDVESIGARQFRWYSSVTWGFGSRVQLIGATDGVYIQGKFDWESTTPLSGPVGSTSTWRIEAKPPGEYTASPKLNMTGRVFASTLGGVSPNSHAHCTFHWKAETYQIQADGTRVTLDARPEETETYLRVDEPGHPEDGAAVGAHTFDVDWFPNLLPGQPIYQDLTWNFFVDLQGPSWVRYGGGSGLSSAIKLWIDPWPLTPRPPE